MITKPSMIYLYLDQSSNKVTMATDYIVQGLAGEVDPETFTLTMKNSAGSYLLRINADMDKMYGTYWSERANKEVRNKKFCSVCFVNVRNFIVHHLSSKTFFSEKLEIQELKKTYTLKLVTQEWG